MVGPERVLSFWLDDIGPAGWYQASDEVDAQVRDGFFDAWVEACKGAFGMWMTYPNGALAYIILMDQFPRNMFRGSHRAFAMDHRAKAVAKAAIHRNWDLRVDEPARQFFYLPLMHSESLCDQEHCIRLICERMPKTGAGMMRHARAHREIIRQFGRFPYRNDALERVSTAPEKLFLDNGGYVSTYGELEMNAA